MKAHIRLAAIALFLFIAGCAGSRQAGSGGGHPDLLYVANQGGATVSIIDIDRLAVSRNR